MSNPEVIKFFEEMVDSFDLYEELQKKIRDELIYGGVILTQDQIGYSDPDLQTIFEVIES